jgi:hypothetical protein
MNDNTNDHRLDEMEQREVIANLHRVPPMQRHALLDLLESMAGKQPPDLDAEPASAAPANLSRGDAIGQYRDRLEELHLRLGTAAGTAEVIGAAFQFGSEYVLRDEAGPGACEMLVREIFAIRDAVSSVVGEVGRIHGDDLKAAAAANLAAMQAEEAAAE